MTTPKRASTPYRSAHRYTRSCTVSAPCGNACCLNGFYRHEYHTCKDITCVACHAGERFGRRARPVK